MNKLIVFSLMGLITISTVVKAQEIGIYAGSQGQQPPVAPDGDELQDESELASALGVDRQALYEDLMRIQEELGGSPPSDQPSQEDY